MAQGPPPAKPFVSPKAKLRALEVNAKDWDIDIGGFVAAEEPPMESSRPAAGSQNNQVAFRSGDTDLMLALAKDEAEAGNATGAASLMSIAERMQVIMDRSEAKMVTALSLDRQPDATTADGGEDEEIERWWPFMHKDLISKGRSVWCTSPETGPKSARGPTPFEAGTFVTWKFKVEQLSGTLCLGLTSLAVDLDTEWTLDEHFNQALFITQNGNLYNGGQLIWEAGTPLQTGDTLSFSLEGDMVSVGINGKLLPASLGPITSSVRPSVQLNSLDDGVSLLEQTQRVREPVAGTAGGKPGTLTLERTRQKELSLLDDEDASIIASLYSTSESMTGSPASFFSDSAASADVSELSVDEPVDIFALSAPPPAAVPGKASPWEMVVADSGKVYYWNKETGVTSWARPADYVEPDAEAFLKDKDAAEAGKKLDKIAEDVSELFDNNADGYKDSHMTVGIDGNGNRRLPGRLVYVDEVTCIGCTNCATIARNTFYMHDEHGRARAFRQGADSDEVVDEAVSTCPVDCIWYVSWDDLVALEQERKYTVINNQARLVGGSNIESTGYFGKGGWGVYANVEMPTKSKASVMNNGAMRCNNCPGRGCYECPLYPVGEHPTYLENAAKREAKKAARKAKQATNCIEAMNMNDNSGLGGTIENVDFSDLFSDDSSTLTAETTE